MTIRRFSFTVLAGLSALAQGQTTVAIDGHINLGVVRESGHGAELGRGYNNWLRLTGREALGDGVSTSVTLEMRYRPDTGMAETGALFQGESTIGVQDAHLGSVRIGRAMSPLWQQKWRFEPWFDSEFMGSLGSYQSGSYTSDPTAALGYANWARIPGALFYDSATVGGFSVHLADGVNRPAGAAGRTGGASLNYAGQAQQGMLAFEQNNRGDRIWFLAGAWRLPAIMVMGSVNQVRLATASHPEHSYVLAARCDLPLGALRFGLGNTHASARKQSAGYIVALSKRTNLYADVYRETTRTALHGAAVGIAHMF
ncbi:MAG: porin [Pseudomonadota bacterium]